MKSQVSCLVDYETLTCRQSRQFQEYYSFCQKFPN
nr:MAG TPA: hypothetical protein [Bacteriophage sp.]